MKHDHASTWASLCAHIFCTHVNHLYVLMNKWKVRMHVLPVLGHGHTLCCGSNATLELYCDHFHTIAFTATFTFECSTAGAIKGICWHHRNSAVHFVKILFISCLVLRKYGFRVYMTLLSKLLACSCSNFMYCIVLKCLNSLPQC